MKWTEAQETAIKKDGSDLLVSAGAGCGKTAILTNRILRLMLDNKVDIDRFMIATFTNAAASSMKEKIRKLLYEKLSSEKNEDTKKFIFRQISKLESASISTIHSFCIRLIREYYHVIDADPSFRIIEETNAKLMKEEAMDILFDEMYSKKNEAFMNASLSFSFQRDESEFRTILLDIYEFIYNRPNPFGWLEEKTEIFENLSGLDKTDQFKELSRLVNGNITLACDLAKEAYEKACETGVVKSSLNNLSNDESGMKVLLKNTEKDCFYITEHSNKDLGIFLNGLRKDQFSDYSTYLSIYNMREQGKEIIKETRNLLSFSKKDTVETLEKLAPHMGAIRHQERKTRHDQKNQSKSQAGQGGEDFRNV